MTDMPFTMLDYPGSDGLTVSAITPPGSKPMLRPTPIIKADALEYLIWDVADFDRQEAFLQEFGMLTAARDEDSLYMRPYGDSPYIYYGRRAKKHAFVGMGFSVKTRDELDVLSRETGHPVTFLDRPGGGEVVRMKGPNGFLVEVTWGIKGPGAIETRQDLLPVNTPTDKPRVNEGIRPGFMPAPVMRMGHCVTSNNKMEETANWYMRHLGLIPSDVLCLDDGSPMVAFMRLDRGDEPADHHTVVVARGGAEGYLHSAYEVLDMDAVAQGQQYLKMKKRKHVWGLGRHILGSQIFDYWMDPNDFEFEHYADGDVFTNKQPTGYHPADPGNIYAWGQDMPTSFYKPGLPEVFATLKAVMKGDLSMAWLKLAGKAMGRAPRPWI